MAILYAGYFDASGKNQEPSQCVGGLVAPIKKLKRLEHLWAKVLEDYGVSVFHMTDFVSSKDEFSQWKGKTEKRREFIEKLAVVIQQNANMLLACTVDLNDWTSVDSRYKLTEQWKHPYVFCGASMVARVERWKRTKQPPAKAGGLGWRLKVAGCG